MKETRNVHIRVTSTGITKANAQTKGLSTGLKGVGSAATMATGGIRAMTTALISSGIGVFVVALGAAIAGIASLISRGAAFSKELSKLGAVSGATSDEMKMLSDNAKRLGSTTAFTANEVLELSTELAKLGFDSPEIVAASKGILSLAAATGTELAEAASVAAGTLNGFGLQADETGRIADVMAKSFSSSALDMEKFRESMKLVAPIAKTVNVSLEESTAALSILADRQVSGSMAGTQLRRVMSDLAMKTGKDFKTSLEISADRLDKATSSAEKLAIAKELVGDRAKGSLIALVENREELERLTEVYLNSAGSAEEMAEKMLDNLDGDTKKLSSAWEGLMLSMEDGDGVLGKLARGGVQLLTSAIEGFRTLMLAASVGWIKFKAGIEKSKISFSLAGDAFKELWLKMLLGFNKIKEAASDVPFLGRAIDKKKLSEERKAIESELKVLEGVFIEAGKKKLAIDKKASEEIIGLMQREAEITKKQREKIIQETIGGQKKISEAEQARLDKEKELRKKFIEKFRKMEEDAEDVTNADKIRRRRDRHLEELKQLKMDTEEKAKLKKDIEVYYEGLIELDRQKAIKSVKDKLNVSDDPEAKINQRREAHLAELAAIEMEETEKAELKKRINDYYDNQITTYQTELALERKKISEDEARAKIQNMYGVLDAASQAAGQESDIARALQAVKLAIQLQELAMSMGVIKKRLIFKAKAAVAETTMEGAKAGSAVAAGAAETAKAGFPQNIPLLIMFAAQAAGLIATFAASKKKVTSIASSMGAGGGGGSASSPVKPAAPSFNVIGRTSAGDNLIADTVASVNDRPMRAYVVEGDVSSAQSLNRNARNLASI